MNAMTGFNGHAKALDMVTLYIPAQYCEAFNKSAQKIAPLLTAEKKLETSEYTRTNKHVHERQISRRYIAALFTSRADAEHFADKLVSYAQPDSMIKDQLIFEG